MATDEKYGWEQTKAIWLDKNTRFFYRILGGLILVGLGIVLGFALFEAKEERSSYLINVFTSILSTAATVLVIEALSKRREEDKAIEALKQQLIRQMRSDDNALAKLAVEEIKARGWYKDGSLRGKNFVTANLNGARLEDFDLRGAKFTGAKLESAILVGADLSQCELGSVSLKNAQLISTNLENAILINTDLQNALLFSANLKGAWFESAMIQGANLNQANLQAAHYLKSVKFDTHTIMPDNTLYIPFDLARFTDSNHTNFWRSNNSKSPAYRKK